MTKKFRTKSRLFSAIFAVFFAIASLFLITSPTPAYATPADSSEETAETTDTPEEEIDTCADQAGSMSWLICPVTKSIANAVDSIYALFGDFLIVKPFSSDSSSPIRLVWDYVRSITNIIFIIIILIVVYSQLTGLGISNFGIKRMLPRLIIAAILVNLSWHICSLAIDVSNVFGIGLRGVFSDIKETALAAGTIKSSAEIDWASAFGVIATGGTIAGLSIAASGGLGAFFWMIIPALLGALVAVVAGLITIAARQAVVALLLMLSPLAFVAYLIPNTEKWFTKWKQTLYKMLIFFPMFSFLFGASDLIGWTIITSAIKDSTIDAFGLILGLAVQVFPLFFAFSLMKMSGTALGAINGAVRKVSNPLQKSVGSFASGERELRRQQYLASKPRNFELTKRFAQGLNDRKYRQAADAATFAEVSKNRGAAFTANYKNRRGAVSRRGERLYDAQKQNLHYQGIAARTAGDFDNGLAIFAGTRAQKRRLDRADNETVIAADQLKYELARNERIKYDNAINYFERTQRAMMAERNSAGTNVEGKAITNADHERYARILKTVNGNHNDALFIGAGAAYEFGAQNRIVNSKFSELFNSTAPTQQLVDVLKSMTTHKDASKYIDSIASGIRALNMRGDTDLATDSIMEITHDLTSNLLAGDGGIQLGTHASQTLASLCMFDIKDNDPFLRRFGKYINLETAHAFTPKADKPLRRNLNVTMEEYVKGEYAEIGDDGEYIYNDDGSLHMVPTRDVVTLLKGTSFAKVERTAYKNMLQTVRRVYTDNNGVVDNAAFEKRMSEINNSILPNVIGDSLTYASGSEQIISLAQYMTGMKEGKNGWKKLWEDSSEPSFGIDPNYFVNLTETYVRSQVPNQIANFKSDMFVGVRALFRDRAVEAYRDATGISRDDKLAEYLAAVDFSALDEVESAAARVNAEKQTDDFYDNLDFERDGVVGAKQHFRDSLGKDVLVRLENSARSGALNNAKGPVVDWLGIKFANRNKRDNNNPNPGTDETTPPSFDDAMRQNLTGNFMHIQSTTLDAPDDYYSQAADILNTYNLNQILQDFTLYYNSNPTTTTADLHNYLLDLINNF